MRAHLLCVSLAALSPRATGFGMFSRFTLSGEALAFQVANYQSLPFNKSARGVAAMIMLGFFTVTSAIGLAAIFFLDGAQLTTGEAVVILLIINSVVYIPLIYLSYRGNIWATAGLFLWFSRDIVGVLLALYPHIFNIGLGVLAFWLFCAGKLWAVVLVERAYRKSQRLAVA